METRNYGKNGQASRTVNLRRESMKRVDRAAMLALSVWERIGQGGGGGGRGEKASLPQILSKSNKPPSPKP